MPHLLTKGAAQAAILVGSMLGTVLAGALLSGNFGNGHIDAYNPNTGVFIDKIRDPHGQVIGIDGLWSLRVGNGGDSGNVNTIYFTAGPNGETDGLFGAITPSP